MAKSNFLGACILAAPFFAIPVAAQQVIAPAQDGGLAEIVVTAQHSQQNLMSVPLSVQAMTGTQLDNESIQTLTDLALVSPGFLASTASGFTEIYIRGIGNNIVNGADPSVATFIDDVPHIWGSSTDSLIDVERVEVLKGAQGGLYGRNATGGVLNIVTRQPELDKFSSEWLVDGGQKSTFRGAGYVNVPLNDILAFNLSIERDSHDAYSPNNVPNDPYTPAMFPGNTSLGTPQATANYLNGTIFHRPANQRDFWATDGKLLFRPADTFKVTLAADYILKNDTVGDAYQKQDPAITQAVLSGILTSFGVPNHLPPGFEQQGGGNFAVSEGDNLKNRIEEYGTSATAVWNAPGVDVTSISAYRRSLTDFIAGAFGSTAPDVTAIVSSYRYYWYQELRGASTFSGPLHLLGGATYLDSDFHGNTNIVFFDTYSAPPLFAQKPVQVFDSVYNYSAYLQAIYDITKDVSFTASGRYVHEKNDAQFVQPTVSGIETTEHKFLPSATLSYKLDDGNIYARFARGFKAGGVNPSAAPIYFPDPSNGSVFGPEQVDTYEIGYRQGLMDHKIQLTTTAFYNKLKDGQISDSAQPAFAGTIITAYVNGGTARTYGLEETFDWRVIDPLTVGVSAGYLDAKYQDFKVENNPVLNNFDLSGQQMINAPTWQMAINADLRLPFNDQFNFVSHALTSYVSRVIFAQSGLPGVLPDAVDPGYWVTNFRAGLETHDRKYSAVVYANNVFDRGYYTWGTSSSGTTMLQWANPRIVGAEITAKF
jgi:iron complex outermembrane receptor protein